MALSNKSSVLAIMTETTEGTPVIPSGATDYTAMQDAFSIDPAFEQLQNNELRNSIGSPQPILGLENPQMSMSHYLRHSGTEGTAPDYNLLLKAVFGSEAVEGTQRVLTSGSSTTVLNGASGVGAYFERGKAVLIKDGTNGYSIRPVHSVSTDALTLGFMVSNAPATGVGLGKAVFYKPAESGHPTLSLWCYRSSGSSNGGAIELIAGARVSQMSISAEAGQFINAAFTMQGTGYYYNPIDITSSTEVLDFLDDSDTRAASVSVKTYKDPHELADAIASSMNSLGSANTFTCTYSNSTGKFTITSNGSTLTLKWNTGTNTASSIASKIGFSTAADSSSALTYTSATAQNWASPYTPTLDSASPNVAKDNEVFLGDATDNVQFTASKIQIDMNDDRFQIKDVTAVSGVSGSLITKRTTTVKLTALVVQHDAEKFRRMRNNTNVRFMYNFGVKSGNNWVAGKCGCFYIPTAVITDMNLVDDNGLLTLELELQAYVDSSSNGEVYLTFL